MREYGWSLVPIPKGSKGPHGPQAVGWNRPRTVANPYGYITDISLAPEIWAADQGVGLMLGPSRICSVDVDHWALTSVALASVGIDIDGLLESAVRIEGNPENAKALYRLPEGFHPSLVKLQLTSEGATKTIFELRAGDVQDVLPPTIHPDVGRPYRWIRGPWEVPEIPVLPAEVMNLWQDWRQLQPTMHSAISWSGIDSTLPAQGLLAVKEFVTSNDLRQVASELSVDDLIESLGGTRAGSRTWHCPFHRPDRNPSFWTYSTSDGRRLWVDAHGTAPVGKQTRNGYAVGDAIDLHQYLHGFPTVGEAIRDLKRQAPGRPAAVSTGTKSHAIGDGGRPFNLTDYGNAERLIGRHGQDLRYCHPTRRWFAWGGNRWQEDDTGEIERRAKETIRAIYGELAQIEDADQKKKLFNHAVASEREPRLKAMMALAGSEAGVPVLPRDMDNDQLLLNVENGTLDLRFAGSDSALKEHRREDLLTCLAPVKFDPKATCPRFLQFLDYAMARDRDLVAYLKRLVGYILTGSAKEQALFIFYGLGDNGKSTLIRLLLHLLGDYAIQAPPDLLLVHRKDSHPTGVADLKGKRLVAGIETEEGAYLAEALVKQLTGNDMIRARRMHQNYFEFEPTHKIILAVNHKPAVRGSDWAIWRRIHLVPFEVKVADEDKDPDLLQKLKTEAPGILRWALEGCAEWQDLRGLAPPTAVLAATESYRQEMDVLGAFLEEHCVIGDRYRVAATLLYQAYVKWCQDSNESPMNQTDFGTKLTEKGLGRERKGGKVWRLGIGLASRAETDQDSW